MRWQTFTVEVDYELGEDREPMTDLVLEALLQCYLNDAGLAGCTVHVPRQRPEIRQR